MGSTAAPGALLGERIARQGVASRPCTTVAAAATHAAGIQAQENNASRLGVRARSTGIDDSQVLADIAAGTVTRTWLMRGTIHLVDTADVRWMVRLVGPSVVRKMRTRWRQLGLDDHWLNRAVDLLPDILAEGPLTRRQITDALAERGLPLTGDHPQASTHVAVHASCVGAICRAADHGRDAAFDLLDRWVGDAPAGPSGDDALAELARRYFAAFSPATAADFATWSGLAAGRAVDLIRDELTETDVDGRPGFRLGEVEPERGVRLLPAFDNYVLGYRDRDALLAEELRPLVYVGGLIRPTLVADGRIAGTWSVDRAGRQARVTVRPFADLTTRTRRAVEREAADVGRFLARPIKSVEVEPW